MRFKIVGANSETGDDVDVMLEASSQSDVEKIAHEKGILVSTITAVTPAHAPAHGPVHAPAHAPTHAPPAMAHASAAHGTATAVAHAPATHAANSHGSRAGMQHPGSPPPAPPGPPVHHKAPEKDFSAISLVEDEEPADSDPAAPHHERAHGLITVNANSPSEKAHTGSGGIQQFKHADAGLEYHIILNQSLFLLESAVNKHLVDGWEPSGGLSVGVSNNALQFFQAMIRRKKPAAPAASPPTPPAPGA